MDERRDLVDREELRRELLRHGYGAHGETVQILDAMPSVEQPVGMTRDDVLAALDAAADRGDEAVVEYLDTSIGKWYGTNLYNWINPEVPRLNVRVRVTEQAPEKVPLTQLVGRTIAGEDDVVTYEPTHHTGRWWWQGAGGSWRVFPEGTLNLETGQVAVRPKAAT